MLLKAALGPSLNLVAIDAAFRFSHELGRLLRIQFNGTKYSSNLAENCSLGQSDVVRRVNVEKEHIFGMIPNSS